MIIVRLVLATIFGMLAFGFGYAAGFLIQVQQPLVTGIVCASCFFLATLFARIK